jgi:hypothetical protein
MSLVSAATSHALSLENWAENLIATPHAFGLQNNVF